MSANYYRHVFASKRAGGVVGPSPRLFNCQTTEGPKNFRAHTAAALPSQSARPIVERTNSGFEPNFLMKMTFLSRADTSKALLTLARPE